MSIPASFRLVLAPPHPAGKPFILAGLVAFAAGLALAGWLAWLGALFALFCLYFFRDPERVAPERTGLALAPADGKVVSIVEAPPPPELGLGDAPRWRVATFLSVLDVHVNRVPVDGKVERIAYRHGSFIDASLDKASANNERNALAIRLPDGRDVAVVQIAGLVARRILCDLHEGESVRAGARFGIIRFGSRTDLYLPVGVRPLVSVGQKMVGGETVIADLSA
ncbi:Phosphatidylserine decarboxylase proenzyme [Rhodovastum atsumiense]|uniref:Phosphatidylserine decarboxylase proenzyme n=1 Tax=Rhodovastum atsumiense TaxID=504468 RepID=A0A5M6IWV8_9PROT|nr:phosphatidylserine decarboxylase [Rhodovastum atsumiense]KAA5612449.1 phosphatidylserine decarboxylase [Rhodovastum atsumiense]CAH2600357.1 Phosphatidylserine decarboxylase proenzyme [Rhodovastum atsumiense]